jgi:hypothetical protein
MLQILIKTFANIYFIFVVTLCKTLRTTIMRSQQ